MTLRRNLTRATLVGDECSHRCTIPVGSYNIIMKGPYAASFYNTVNSSPRDTLVSGQLYLLIIFSIPPFTRKQTLSQKWTQTLLKSKNMTFLLFTLSHNGKRPMYNYWHLAMKFVFHFLSFFWWGGGGGGGSNFNI